MVFIVYVNSGCAMSSKHIFRSSYAHHTLAFCYFNSRLDGAQEKTPQYLDSAFHHSCAATVT